MSGAHKGLLKTLKWQQNVILCFAPRFQPFSFLTFSRDPPWGAITFKLEGQCFPPFLHPHSLHATKPKRFSSSSFRFFKSCWGWRGAEKNHSISPSVRQEPKIPARDAIWYKSIIMKVQHGAKWVSTSAARGANDKTASLCSLACL